MNAFKVVRVVDYKTIQVSPEWQILYKNSTLKGDLINIRGLEDVEEHNQEEAEDRLIKIFSRNPNNITFDSPEVISHADGENAVASCSVYIGRANILYYFPELVVKSRE